MSDNNDKFKIITTVFGFLLTCVMTLSLFITTGIKDDVKSLDSKVMLHLTNHDMHVIRDQIVSKAEFNLKCQFDDKNNIKLDRNIEEIKVYLLSLRK